MVLPPHKFLWCIFLFYNFFNVPVSAQAWVKELGLLNVLYNAMYADSTGSPVQSSLVLMDSLMSGYQGSGVGSLAPRAVQAFDPAVVSQVFDLVGKGFSMVNETFKFSNFTEFVQMNNSNAIPISHSSISTPSRTNSLPLQNPLFPSSPSYVPTSTIPLPSNSSSASTSPMESSLLQSSALFSPIEELVQPVVERVTVVGLPQWTTVSNFTQTVVENTPLLNNTDSIIENLQHLPLTVPVLMSLRNEELGPLLARVLQPDEIQRSFESILHQFPNQLGTSDPLSTMTNLNNLTSYLSFLNSASQVISMPELGQAVFNSLQDTSAFNNLPLSSSALNDISNLHSVPDLLNLRIGQLFPTTSLPSLVNNINNNVLPTFVMDYQNTTKQSLEAGFTLQNNVLSALPRFSTTSALLSNALTYESQVQQPRRNGLDSGFDYIPGFIPNVPLLFFKNLTAGTTHMNNNVNLQSSSLSSLNEVPQLLTYGAALARTVKSVRSAIQVNGNQTSNTTGGRRSLQSISPTRDDALSLSLDDSISGGMAEASLVAALPSSPLEGPGLRAREYPQAHASIGARPDTIWGSFFPRSLAFPEKTRQAAQNLSTFMEQQRRLNYKDRQVLLRLFELFSSNIVTRVGLLPGDHFNVWFNSFLAAHIRRESNESKEVKKMRDQLLSLHTGAMATAANVKPSLCKVIASLSLPGRLAALEILHYETSTFVTQSNSALQPFVKNALLGLATTQHNNNNQGNMLPPTYNRPTPIVVSGNPNFRPPPSVVSTSTTSTSTTSTSTKSASSIFSRRSLQSSTLDFTIADTDQSELFQSRMLLVAKTVYASYDWDRVPKIKNWLRRSDPFQFTLPFTFPPLTGRISSSFGLSAQVPDPWDPKFCSFGAKMTSNPSSVHRGGVYDNNNIETYFQPLLTVYSPTLKGLNGLLNDLAAQATELSIAKMAALSLVHDYPNVSFYVGSNLNKEMILRRLNKLSDKQLLAFSVLSIKLKVFFLRIEQDDVFGQIFNNAFSLGTSAIWTQIDQKLTNQSKYHSIYNSSTTAVTNAERSLSDQAWTLQEKLLLFQLNPYLSQMILTVYSSNGRSSNENNTLRSQPSIVNSASLEKTLMLWKDSQNLKTRLQRLFSSQLSLFDDSSSTRLLSFLSLSDVPVSVLVLLAHPEVNFAVQSFCQYKQKTLLEYSPFKAASGRSTITDSKTIEKQREKLFELFNEFEDQQKLQNNNNNNSILDTVLLSETSLFSHSFLSIEKPFFPLFIDVNDIPFPNTDSIADPPTSSP